VTFRGSVDRSVLENHSRLSVFSDVKTEATLHSQVLVEAERWLAMAKPSYPQTKRSNEMLEIGDVMGSRKPRT
jgi:hypothetical protein